MYLIEKEDTMPIVSLAGLLKSSTVLWILGISYNAPKDHRDISKHLCTSDVYAYKNCEDLQHYITPSVPGNNSSEPDFIGNYPWIYKLMYGQELTDVDQGRLAVAQKIYEEQNCKGHFKGFEQQYASLEQKDLMKYLQHHILPRIAQENADQVIDQKRKKICKAEFDSHRRLESNRIRQ